MAQPRKAPHLTASIALRITSFALGLALLCPGMNTVAQTAGDVAEARNHALRSVGRLRVPAVRYRDGYPQRFEERCSATLITQSRQKRSSRLILSAWHCVEDYRELSRRLIFETPDGLQSEAKILVSGGSMDSDWVLLQLHTPMEGPALLIGQDIPAPINGLLMAGYPKDPDTLPWEPGESAPRSLETSESCRVTGRLKQDPRSDCVLRKGASGGAVFSEELNFSYLGVISQGDQISQSIFVPLKRFRAQIRSYLNQQ